MGVVLVGVSKTCLTKDLEADFRADPDRLLAGVSKTGLLNFSKSKEDKTTN
jgi:hypothetical protein